MKIKEFKNRKYTLIGKYFTPSFLYNLYNTGYGSIEKRITHRFNKKRKWL